MEMISMEHAKLLQMISQNFYVAYRAESQFPDPGRCRVQGFSISELEKPEVLLLKEGESDPDFYPYHELFMFPLGDSDFRDPESEQIMANYFRSRERAFLQSLSAQHLVVQAKAQGCDGTSRAPEALLSRQTSGL